MLHVLQDVERYLPSFLLEESSWTGVFADSEKPVLRRLWRQYGEYRIYLHHFSACAAVERFPHPHPWQSAMRVCKGVYDMGISYALSPTEQTADLCRVVMQPGSRYEMTDERGCHWIRPNEDELYTVMVAGPVIWQQNRILANHPTRPLTDEERARHFAFFRKFYGVAQ